MEAQVWTLTGLLAATIVSTFFYLGNRIESRFDRLESRFDGFESRFDRIESRFDGFESRLTGSILGWTG